MEELSIRQTAIESLIQQLLASESLEAEEFFDSLTRYLSDRDIEKIYQIFKSKADTQSIYWLIRYLVAIERHLGLEKLFELSQDENELIRNMATSAITKINLESRIDILIRLLDSPRKDQVIFSAEKLGRARAPKAVIPLLGILDKYIDDEEAATTILKALGLIKDMRAFLSLEHIAGKTKGKIQEEAFLSLSQLTAGKHPFYLKKYLSSENIKIREIAYHLLIRLESNWAESNLANGLKREEAEDLKINILTLIKSVKTYKLFKAIFDLAACCDSSSKLRMIAESAIRKTKSSRNLRWLIALDKKSSFREKTLVLRLLSEYQKNDEVLRIFCREFKKSKNNLIRLIAIESLGELGDKRAIGFLEDIINQQGEFSYAAAVSLANLINHSDGPLIKKMFEVKGQYEDLVSQAFLHFLLRLKEECEFLDSLEFLIEKLVASKSEHVRYLAIRLLSRIKNKDKIRQLIASVCLENELKVKKAFQRSIYTIIQKNPESLLDIVYWRQCQEKIMVPYYSIFRHLDLHREELKRIIKKILVLIFEHQPESQYKDSFFIGRLYVFLRIQAQRHRAGFLDYLHFEDSSDSEKKILLRVLNRTDIFYFYGLSVDFMAEQYLGASAETKLEYLEFFKNLSVRNPEVENSVFDSFWQEEDGKIRAKIESVIQVWLKNQQLQKTG